MVHSVSGVTPTHAHIPIQPFTVEFKKRVIVIKLYHGNAGSFPLSASTMSNSAPSPAHVSSYATALTDHLAQCAAVNTDPSRNVGFRRYWLSVIGHQWASRSRFWIYISMISGDTNHYWKYVVRVGSAVDALMPVSMRVITMIELGYY